MPNPQCTSKCSFTRKASGVYVCSIHQSEHVCGKNCRAPKCVTNQGTFCSFTGVETYGPAEILYSNPLTTDSFKRRRGGVHWTSEVVKRKALKKTHVKTERIKRHSAEKILAALRKIFTSANYEAYIMKERARRQVFIAASLGKSAPFTIPQIVKLSQRASAKFPGATKTLMTMKDPRLEQLSESILMYSRQAPNIAPLSAIKNTSAFVAAVLTMLTTGLEINGVKAFPQVPWLAKKLPPPVAMTTIGIPCRSVSLAVRHLKKLVYGADFSGIPTHFFTVQKHCVCNQADTD